jgi:hypothetical protein
MIFMKLIDRQAILHKKIIYGGYSRHHVQAESLTLSFVKLNLSLYLCLFCHTWEDINISRNDFFIPNTTLALTWTYSCPCYLLLVLGPHHGICMSEMRKGRPLKSWKMFSKYAMMNLLWLQNYDANVPKRDIVVRPLISWSWFLL